MERMKGIGCELLSKENRSKESGKGKADDECKEEYHGAGMMEGDEHCRWRRW